MIYRNSGEVSGQPPLNFKNYSGSIQDYLIEGNTSQNGTPTPDNPVDVVGCGERTENLFSLTLIRYEFAINSYESRIVEFPGSYMYVIPTNGREYFTLKIYNPGVTVSVIRLALYDKPVPQAEIIEYFEEATNTENPEITIYNVNNSPYLIIQIGSAYVSQYGITGVMLNSGSTALPYEPYGYKIPLTVNGTEYPIYLGQVPTTRRIRKLVLTGEESRWTVDASVNQASLPLPATAVSRTVLSTHYKGVVQAVTGNVWINATLRTLFIMDTANATDLTVFKQFLAAQYANGNPVTVWYVLATEETGIVNEPLHKIGDYADSISKSQSNLPIPTISGQNTLTIPTTISPSNVSLTLDQKEIEKIYEGGKKEVEFSGVPPISFNAIGSQLEDYLIEGNTSQNGTPSPTNPVEVMGCGEKTSQLFNKDNFINGDDFYITNKVIPSVNCDMFILPCKPNTTYTVSRQVITKRLSIGFVDSIPLYENQVVSGAKAKSDAHVITSTSAPDSKYLVVYYAKHAGNDSNTPEEIQSSLDTMMVVEGDEAPATYEPYGYKLSPIVNGMEYPIYLGQVPTTRRVRKFVLTGDEDWTRYSSSTTFFISSISDYARETGITAICTHFKSRDNVTTAASVGNTEMCFGIGSIDRLFINSPDHASSSAFATYLTQQYQNGTPVTVWYVIEEPETAVVNESLNKIGSYADSISKTQSNLPIPITTGSNTLSIETTIQPSNITISYNKQTEIAEVYGGIGENYPIYYMNRTIEGTSPIMFKGLGKDLKDYTILGNTSQNGTPTPEAPVDVVGCGIWDETQQSYKLPPTVNGTEYQIYLGQVPTVRKIGCIDLSKCDFVYIPQLQIWECTTIPNVRYTSSSTELGNALAEKYINHTASGLYAAANNFAISTSSVSVNTGSESISPSGKLYYALATPETGIVNEPLMKIGDYADTLMMAQAGVMIQTVAGANTLTIDTTVQPSSVSITGNIKPIT